MGDEESSSDIYHFIGFFLMVCIKGKRAEEVIRSSGTGVTNMSLLMEQQTFLSAMSTLQPSQCVSKAYREYVQNLM